MIKLSKAEKAETTGQLYMTILIDAKAAGIINRGRKNVAEQSIGRHLVFLSQAVTAKEDTGSIEQEFKEYLCESLFKHYVDVISINDFIYNSRQTFHEYKDNIVLAGFHMMYEYLNDYKREEEDVRIK